MDEVDRRIEEARQKAERTKETNEFLQSLKPGDEVLKPVYNPEAWIMRDKLKAAALRGELVKTDCRHPDAYLQQYLDTDPSTMRRELPTNLYECGICHMILWMVDPWGVPKSDA